MNTDRNTVLRTGVAVAATGFVALAMAAPAHAAVHDKWLAVNCPQPYSQHCDPMAGIDVASDGPIFVEFTGDSGGCADMALNLFVNGKHWAATQIGPGQSDGGNTIDPADVPASPDGKYHIYFQATGVEGGCNTGAMSGWAGNLHVETS
jgi:hypothetical protein